MFTTCLCICPSSFCWVGVPRFYLVLEYVLCCTQFGHQVAGEYTLQHTNAAHLPDLVNTPTARPSIHLSNCVQCSFISVQKSAIQLFLIPIHKIWGWLYAAVVICLTPGLQSITLEHTVKRNRHNSTTHSVFPSLSFLHSILSLSLSLSVSALPRLWLTAHCSLTAPSWAVSLQLVLEKLPSDTCNNNNTHRHTQFRALLQLRTQDWTSGIDDDEDDDGGCMDDEEAATVDVPGSLCCPHWLWIPWLLLFNGTTASSGRFLLGVCLSEEGVDMKRVKHVIGNGDAHWKACGDTLSLFSSWCSVSAVDLCTFCDFFFVSPASLHVKTCLAIDLFLIWIVGVGMWKEKSRVCNHSTFVINK